MREMYEIFIEREKDAAIDEDFENSRLKPNKKMSNSFLKKDISDNFEGRAFRESRINLFTCFHYIKRLSE